MKLLLPTMSVIAVHAGRFSNHNDRRPGRRVANAHWNECGKMDSCLRSCESPWDDKSNAICLTVCVPHWECNPGYWKNKRGKCIKEAVCKVRYRRNCPIDSHFEECGNSCKVRQCGKLHHINKCPDVCEPRCECNEGFVWNAEWGICQNYERCAWYLSLLLDN